MPRRVLCLPRDERHPAGLSSAAAVDFTGSACSELPVWPPARGREFAVVKGGHASAMLPSWRQGIGRPENAADRDSGNAQQQSVSRDHSCMQSTDRGNLSASEPVPRQDTCHDKEAEAARALPKTSKSGTASETQPPRTTIPCILVAPPHSERFAAKGKKWELHNSPAGMYCRVLGETIMLLQTGRQTTGRFKGMNRILGKATWAGVKGPFHSVAHAMDHAELHQATERELRDLRMSWHPQRRKFWAWTIDNFEPMHAYAKHTGGQVWTRIEPSNILYDNGPL
jgi:hypothetical protein